MKRLWIVAPLATAMLLPAFQENPASPNAGENTAAATQPQRKGLIGGVVIDAGAEKPVKDVTLLLVSATGGAVTPMRAKSDESGHFAFKDLEGGVYMLIGEHPKYARQTYGSRAGLMGGTPLTLQAGGEMKDVMFKLQANAVASGRVLDEDGEPLPNIMVAAVKGMYQRGKRQFLPLGTAKTDDRGEFRIANLAAGRYLMVASPLTAGGEPKPAAAEAEETYIATYYPNSAEAAGAAPVEISAGRDLGGLDVRLRKSKAVRLKGEVTGVAGDGKATVRLIPKDAGVMGMLFGRNASVKSDGTFEIAGVAPGSYTLRVSGDPIGMRPLGAGMALEVGDQPVEGIIVATGSPLPVNGAIVMDQDSKAALGGARVILEPMGGLTMIPPNTKVAEDGTFTLQDVPPEKYLVRLMGGPEDTYVKSVRLGSREMGDDGLELGTSTEKLEIRLDGAAARVEGVINGQDDKPMSGVTVALIPKSGRYLLYQSALTDQKGAFRFKNVTPGEYKVLAWEEVEPNAFLDPDFVKPFEGKAESVSLKERDHKAVIMRAIPQS
ncbi:MAG: carboxypeptidase regulatory-like domain-containing protein [Bryobacteraceae bacterium]|nr:carboxypeptidase regulatory-like domain-containing protein [Bryobacteraceae bacterium]